VKRFALSRKRKFSGLRSLIGGLRKSKDSIPVDDMESLIIVDSPHELREKNECIVGCETPFLKHFVKNVSA
jgi:hypothetical protein